MANSIALPTPGSINSAIKPATALTGWGMNDDEIDSSAQVAKTLANGSPLINQVTQRSNAAFAGRGLLNSSMAVQAGNEAAITKALDLVNPTLDRKVNMLTTDRNNASAMDRTVLQLNSNKDLATMSEQGQSARQDRSIAANAAESAAGRTFQAGESALGRTQQSSMLAVQNDYDTAKSALDRAQQTAMADKGIGAQQALQHAQQAFTGAQSTLDRAQQTQLQTNQQGFTGTQAAADRTQQTTVQTAQQTFTSAQSALERAQQTAITDKSLGAQQALQAAQQGFQAAQSGLDRAQRGDLQANQQTFTGGQSAADRAQQTSIADKNIEANQAASTTARDFAATQATLIRDSNIAESLQTGYRAASAATYDGYTRDVNAIQTADLEPAAKEAQILNLNEMYTQRQKFVNATYTAMPSWQSQWSQVSIQFGKPP